MIETVKITKLFKSDKNKEDKPFISKTGKKFWKVAIKTDKYPDDWMSALAFDETDAVMMLEEGQEIKVRISESNGFKNFNLPTRLDMLEEMVQELKQSVKELQEWRVKATYPGNPAETAKKVFGVDGVPPIEESDMPF